MNEETTACSICDKQTPMLGTKLCDPCWELQRRIEAAPELALMILCKLLKFNEVKEKSIYDQVFGV